MMWSIVSFSHLPLTSPSVFTHPCALGELTRLTQGALQIDPAMWNRFSQCILAQSRHISDRPLSISPQRRQPESDRGGYVPSLMLINVRTGPSDTNSSSFNVWGANEPENRVSFSCWNPVSSRFIFYRTGTSDISEIPQSQR